MDQTLKNLTAAFIGESQARNRYTMYSKIAKKEGFEQISAIFAETANHEAEHAKWLFRLIQELKKKNNTGNNAIVLEADAPTVLGNTAENLKASIAGETHEFTDMYPSFASLAEEEGFQDIAVRLRSIAKAEAHHAERYKKLLKEVEASTVFKKAEEVSWACRKCGYEHSGSQPPEQCPACNHPKAYFQKKVEDF